MLSLCPQVFGMYLIKLAVAVVLAGGVQRIDSSGTKIRGIFPVPYMFQSVIFKQTSTNFLSEAHHYETDSHSNLTTTFDKW